MKVEKSCGAIVFTREHGEIKYVIVRSLEGYYGFPKGHVEDGETEQETAVREIKEETGLDVTLFEDFRTTDEYHVVLKDNREIRKHVVYFLAEFQNQDLHAQEQEISAIELMSYEKAMESFKFDRLKRLLQEAENYLKKENKNA